MNKQLLSTIQADQFHSLLEKRTEVIPRKYSLSSFQEDKEITVITGVRRSGKSSLLREFIQLLPYESRIIYLNFEDPRLLNFSASDFETLYKIWLESDPSKRLRIAVFDEIQNIEGWERWMNFFAEQKNFKVFITGSNSRLLSSELATLLTGRHEDLVLYPLSVFEVCRHINFNLFNKAADITATLTTEEESELTRICLEYFKFGGFPRVWQSRNLSLLGEYYTDILYRDIVRRYRLRQPKLIASFGSHVMSDLGRLLNKSKLTKSIGASEINTVNRYFDYFDECYLGHEVRKFDSSIRRQNRSLSKFYAVDPILASRVGISSESKETFYFENFVYIEQLRRKARVYYWREPNCSEIDFVIETQNGERHLVQVAWSIKEKTTLERELKGFKDFEAAHPRLKIHRKEIITMDSVVGINLPKGIRAIPFYRWALQTQEF